MICHNSSGYGKMNKNLKRSIWVISISALLVVTMLVAMGIGRYSISIGDIINVLLPESLSSGNVDPNVKTVIYNIRLPRVLLAALAGAVHVMGVSNNITVLAATEGNGFDGIAVALIANSNPIGVIFSGLLFGALKYGGTKMQTIQAPSEVINIVIGSIVYFIALSSVIRVFFMKMIDKKKKGGNE